MAYPIASNSVVQVTTRGLLFNQTVMNVWHWRWEQGTTPITDGANALEDLQAALEASGWRDSYQAMLAPQVINIYWDFQWIHPTRYVKRTNVLGPSGTAPDATTVTNLAAALEFRSDIATRRGSGTKHIAGILRGQARQHAPGASGLDSPHHLFQRPAHDSRHATEDGRSRNIAGSGTCGDLAWEMWGQLCAHAGSSTPAPSSPTPTRHGSSGTTLSGSFRIRQIRRIWSGQGPDSRTRTSPTAYRSSRTYPCEHNNPELPAQGCWIEGGGRGGDQYSLPPSTDSPQEATCLFSYRPHHAVGLAPRRPARCPGACPGRRERRRGFAPPWKS